MATSRWRKRGEVADIPSETEGIDARLGGDTLAGDAEAVNAWAKRMTDKRNRAKRLIEDRQGERPDGPTYWTADQVFRESERVAQAGAQHRPDPHDVARALSELGLGSTASLAQVESRYRALVKRHHPDRHVGAEAETQQLHAERFHTISEARSLLLRALT